MSMAQKEFTLYFSAYDRKNDRHLYLKADGKRFDQNQTIKICLDVKYDVTVTIKPPLQKLVKMVIGGEELFPESTEASDSNCEYKLSWMTTGFRPTKRGERNDFTFVYHFQNAEVIHKIQAKLYSQENSSHITWGTQVTKTELTVNGLEPIIAGNATPLQKLFPSKIQYK